MSHLLQETDPLPGIAAASGQIFRGEAIWIAPDEAGVCETFKEIDQVVLQLPMLGAVGRTGFEHEFVVRWQVVSAIEQLNQFAGRARKIRCDPGACLIGAYDPLTMLEQ